MSLRRINCCRCSSKDSSNTATSKPYDGGKDVAGQKFHGLFIHAAAGLLGLAKCSRYSIVA